MVRFEDDMGRVLFVVPESVRSIHEAGIADGCSVVVTEQNFQYIVKGTPDETEQRLRTATGGGITTE